MVIFKNGIIHSIKWGYKYLYITGKGRQVKFIEHDGK